MIYSIKIVLITSKKIQIEDLKVKDLIDELKIIQALPLDSSYLNKDYEDSVLNKSNLLKRKVVERKTAKYLYFLD